MRHLDCKASDNDFCRNVCLFAPICVSNACWNKCPAGRPGIEHWGTRYVVDLKRRHFRQLSSPFEVIEFGSERGKGMCVVVGENGKPAVEVRREGSVALVTE